MRNFISCSQISFSSQKHSHSVAMSSAVVSKPVSGFAGFAGFDADWGKRKKTVKKS